MTSQRMLVDFHHSSLMRAHTLLFEDRLGIDVYRPIGMEWYREDLWAINDQVDTAKQFLDYESQPLDGTPPLNEPEQYSANQFFRVFDPGHDSTHGAVTLQAFMDNEWDYLMYSIPQHERVFRQLHQLKPKATLLCQIGNNEMIPMVPRDIPCLASVKLPFEDPNFCSYRQEFDQFWFYPTEVPRRWTTIPQISTYVNVLSENTDGWRDYWALRQCLDPAGSHAVSGPPTSAFVKINAFGGQNPQGNWDGPRLVGSSMRDQTMILHSKRGGDGYGHVIHSAFAVGRPLVIRPAQYRNQFAWDLIEAAPGAYLDLDMDGIDGVSAKIKYLLTDDGYPTLREMGAQARFAFEQVVDFAQDSVRVSEWLQRVRI